MSETLKERKVAGPAAFGMAIVGIVLMAGGMLIHNNHTLASIENPLIEMGIPLDLGKTIATIGVFLILFKVVEFFFFNPLHEAIDNRTTELERTFTEAESLRAEMTQMKTDYEKRLADTEAQARAQIQEQIKEATDLKNQLKADAQRQVEEYKRSAMDEIDAEKNKVMTELRVHVANLSMQATEKILGANIDKDRNRQLVDEFLDTVEVKN